MKKRILSVCLCLVLVSGGVLSSINMMRVKAAAAPAIPINAETAAELLMVLYSVLESGMIASGAKEGLDAYESSKSLSDAFYLFLDSMGPDVGWSSNTEFVLENGQTVSLDQETYEVEFADGSTRVVSRERFFDMLLFGTITLDPDDTETDTDEVEDLDEYIKNKMALRDAFHEEWVAMNGSGGGDQDPDDGGDDQQKDLFTKVKKVTIGAGLVTAIGSFIGSLFDGETELDPGTYYTGTEYMYTGKLPLTSSGQYHYQGRVGPMYVDGSGYYTINTVGSNLFVGYVSSFGFLSFGYVDASGGVNIGNYLSNQMSGISYDSNTWYNVNFPVFSSADAVKDYYLTGDASVALNAPIYDHKDLTDSVPVMLAPLTGGKFSPNQMPVINNALHSAVQDLPEPEVGSDSKTNTETYKQTITETMQEVAPEMEPETNTGTGTDTDTETGTGTATQPGTDSGSDTETGEDMDAENYKTDLTMIFPFCLPFDLIHLFQTLSADPVTPSFEFPVVIPPLNIEEYVIIDLSFMDDVMEIFRIGELGLFIIGLIVGTRKMIKW